MSPPALRRLRAASAIGSLALAAGLVLGACAGGDLSGTPAHRMSAWFSGTGEAGAIGAVSDTSASIDRAIATHQPSGAVRTLCAVLAQDAEVANSNLPSPDDSVTNLVAKAATDAYDAGTSCYGAGGRGSAMPASTAQRHRAVDELASAMSQVAAIVGHTVSTSTTLPPSGSGDPFAPG